VIWLSLHESGGHRISTKMASSPQGTFPTSEAPSCKASQEHHSISPRLPPPPKLSDLSIKRKQKQLHLLASPVPPKISTYKFDHLNKPCITTSQGCKPILPTTDCQLYILSSLRGKKGRSTAIQLSIKQSCSRFCRQALAKHRGCPQAAHQTEETS
jgi:hypothetical protein